MPNVVTSQPIDTATLDRNFARADVQFDGLDHSTASYQGRVFLNTPDADEETLDEVQDASPPDRIPSADTIARDFQRFLRQRRPDGE